MIQIVTDSVASIPAEDVSSLGIQVASLHVHHDGEEYVDSEMDVDEFYEHIGEMVNNIPTSSQPSTHCLESMFAEIAENGDELLGIFMSSLMSGTLDAAVQAAKSVAQRFPGFRYSIIDSMTNSYDEAFCVYAAVEARDEGATLEECAQKAAQTVASTRFLFTPETLAFLKSGGRIGNVSALLASIIKIRPVITVSDGESSMFARVRTSKKALDAIAKKFQQDCRECQLVDAVVHYIGSSEKAREWAKHVIEPIMGRAVRVLPVSPVIGCHVGPAVGIAYRCARALTGKVSFSVSKLIHSSY